MNKLAIKTNSSFKELTTFRIGGKIKYFIEAKNEDEICRAIAFAKENNLPVFILGGGSDVLVNDRDFNGVVIKYVADKFEINDDEITARGGMEWDELANESVKNSLQGIECLSGIPGTVGAAPIQNIGAYGQELRNTFVKLRAYDIKSERFVELVREDCNFSYRESIFKKSENWQRFVITEVTLRLKRNGKPEIKYESLKNYLRKHSIENPSLKEVRNAVLRIRSGKFENPKEVGNAGSFFKNPILDQKSAKRLSKTYPDIVLREQENGMFKGSAGWFIEKAGWKGKIYKEAGVSPRHALILINPKGLAKASEVFELSKKVIDDVNEKFGVKLEREVQLINF